MINTFFIALLSLLFGPQPAIAADQFIEKIILPSGHTVVVAEAELEARSIGSFSIRLYQPAATIDATTFFLHGLIHSRDGFIKTVKLYDLNADGQLEIIVVVQSAGTGGYLSAHAFAVSEQLLMAMSSIAGLDPYSDPINALLNQMMK
jgi:hypothetical protein